MEVIIDTHALSAWLDGDKEIIPALNKTSTIHLSPIVLGEYCFGILSSKFKAQYQKALEELEIDFPVLGINTSTSNQYADIRQELKTAGTPIPWHDIWIAAQARQHQLGVLTRDQHFLKVRNLQVVSW